METLTRLKQALENVNVTRVTDRVNIYADTQRHQDDMQHHALAVGRKRIGQKSAHSLGRLGLSYAATWSIRE